MANKKKPLQLRLKGRIDATEAQVDSFTLRINDFLRRRLSKVVADVKSGTDRREAIAVLGSLQTTLEEAGLEDELKKLRKIYAKQLDFISDEFEQQGSKDVFGRTDKATVEQLITFDTEKVATKLEGYVQDVRSVLMRGVLAGEVPDFQDVHDKFGGALASNLQTELNTMMQGFNRAVTMSKGKELGFDLFLYLGPDDSITRPFCNGLLKKDPAIYTLDEITSMDNDQGLDVMTYGGGYNCRHQWRPVSPEFAEELGYVSQS